MEQQQVPATFLKIDPTQLLQRISSDLFLTNGRNSRAKTLSGTNAYFLGSGPEKILIDTSDLVEEFEKNLAVLLQKLEFTVTHAIITHFHPDHVDALQYVLKHCPSTRVYKCKSEESRVFDEALQKNYGFSYIFVEDGQVLELEGYELEILRVPGHSEDSLAVFERKSQRLFVGDTVLGEGTGTSIKDLDTYMKSLERLLSMQIKTLLPAHGSVFLTEESSMQVIRAYYDHRKKREEEIVVVLRKYAEISLEELLSKVYCGIAEGLIKTARDNLRTHVEKLRKCGEVEVKSKENGEVLVVFLREM